MIYMIATAILLSASGADAQQKPVIVELYTSQGCSSCPPADAYLKDLIERDYVIALAFHVDYWDYIGWKDIFAKPEFTKRQRAYAKASGQNMVYTPQMIINGRDAVVGNRFKDVEVILAKHETRTPDIRVNAIREADVVKVTATTENLQVGPFEVHLVRYTPAAQVMIERGENAGKTLSYSNIVRQIDVIETWSGQAPLMIEFPVTGEDPGVILIQRMDGTASLAAAAMFR